MVRTRLAKEEHAVAAATQVFTRYGYARTTMGDIARAVGISRPALYLLFPDKEAVFTRVIGNMDDRKHKELADVLAGSGSVRDKLLRVSLNWGLHGVELAAAHPDAADLFDLRFPAVRQVYARFEALIAELIVDAVAASDIGADPTEVARVLVHGMRGLKAAAADVNDMRRLITVHVGAVAQSLA